MRNILLLVADDLGRMTGCYGEPAIATPNIDRLAAEGTRFDMAFTSTASCSASRSVIYTGLHTHETGQYGLHHDHHHFMTFEHVETAPALFNRAGYLTGIIGKVHVGPSGIYPWAVREESGTRDVAWMRDRAAAFFDKARDEATPFFLTLGFIDPHRDTTRSGFGNEFAHEEVEDRVFEPEDVSVPPFLSDLPEVRMELAEYYRSVYRLDQGVGLVLEALERAGLAGDTLVCFLSDNGAPFLNSKTTLYDAGVHLPLIIRKPGGGAGVANPNLVSFTDILPTFLDWAGADALSDARKGRSLLPILEEDTLLPDWQRVFGSHTFHEITNYWPTRFLRTPRHKYHRNVAWQLDFPFSGDLYGSLSWEGIRNAEPVRIGERPLKSYIRRPPEELYDLEADPREVTNLAADPQHQELLADMRAAMEEWQKATGDPWLYRDGVSLRAVQLHIDAGLAIPDRFDFDPDKPGNRA
ncbi:sulfatase [Oricola sp.]|uniref:sulfatase family protein n=1 Tax=Oricola sp. TaxID=1979950 RepID=UPI0025DA9EC9|nr:sulfatase [Oricola sp.]MCI5074530.1 sulfatase [Oricola sp.]